MTVTDGYTVGDIPTLPMSFKGPCDNPDHTNISAFITGADRLADMFTEQAKLQTLLGNVPAEMTPETLANYRRSMAWATVSELVEAMDETGWKPWATSRHTNREEFMDEMTDVWLFVLNMMLSVGMTADDLLERFVKKQQNARLRHYNQYDGVTSKCPKCKRAYDNEAVKCKPESVDDNNRRHPAMCAYTDSLRCPQCYRPYADTWVTCQPVRYIGNAPRPLPLRCDYKVHAANNPATCPMCNKDYADTECWRWDDDLSKEYGWCCVTQRELNDNGVVNRA